MDESDQEDADVVVDVQEAELTPLATQNNDKRVKVIKHFRDVKQPESIRQTRSLLHYS